MEQEGSAPQSGNFLTLISESSCLPFLGLCFLTINSVLSIYRARNDPWTVAFLVFAYFNLLALFGCLQAFEKLQSIGAEEEEEKRRLKAVVWVLATSLNFTFAYRVAEMVPWATSVVIGATSGSVAAASFYALFFYREPKTDGPDHLHLTKGIASRTPRFRPGAFVDLGQGLISIHVRDRGWDGDMEGRIHG